jgi:type IV secretory pathway TraG/TraD family ATPase VirD4
MTRAAYSAGQNMARGVEQRRRTAEVRPSRAALKSGILCPGDGPPSGSLGSFLDYREILLPEDIAPLRAGAFPIGRVKHPRANSGAHPAFLGWEEVRRHVAIIGPAGSGKTSNLMAPWVVGAAEAGLGSVVVDTKGDFVQEISNYKLAAGIIRSYPVIRWDVEDPAASRPWNPLGEVRTVNDAAQVALAFLGEIDPLDHQKPFAERDHRWLRGLVYLLAFTRGAQAHPRELYSMVVSQSALQALAQSAPAAAIDLIDLIRFPAAEYAKATWALANRLSWLAEPQLAAMLDGTMPRSFTLRDAIASGAVIIVGARVSGGERTMIAGALMLNMLKLRCMEHFGNQGPNMLWVLDEAPKYARRIELDQILDFMRGAGVAACIGIQDVTQLGDESAQIRMLANADTVIVLKGASAAAASFLGKRLGDIQAATASMSVGPQGGWTPTVSHQSKPMLGDREIMHPPVGGYGGIVHVRGSSPHPFLVTFD